MTEAQRKLLELAGVGELEISYGHPEAQALADAGLLTIGERILSGGSILFSRSAFITEAGRAALESPHP